MVDTLRAKSPELWRYWTKGPGLARWVDKPHPWTSLHRALLEEGVPARMADGLATNIYHAVTGKYPEHKKKVATSGGDVSSLDKVIAAAAPTEDPLDKVLSLAVLTAEARKKLPKKQFAVPKGQGSAPEKDSYPIHDRAHARNALARVAQHGTDEEKKKVRAAVKRKYPDMIKDDDKD